MTRFAGLKPASTIGPRPSSHLRLQHGRTAVWDQHHRGYCRDCAANPRCKHRGNSWTRPWQVERFGRTHCCSWENISNTCLSACGGIPIPVSRTLTTASASRQSSVSMMVPPRSVYFALFESRLENTCARRWGSPSMMTGTVGRTSITNSCACASIRGREASTALASTSGKRTFSRFKATSPRAIRRSQRRSNVPRLRPGQKVTGRARNSSVPNSISNPMPTPGLTRRSCWGRSFGHETLVRSSMMSHLRSTACR